MHRCPTRAAFIRAVLPPSASCSCHTSQSTQWQVTGVPQHKHQYGRVARSHTEVYTTYLNFITKTLKNQTENHCHPTAHSCLQVTETTLQKLSNASNFQSSQPASTIECNRQSKQLSSPRQFVQNKCVHSSRMQHYH